MKKYSVRKAEFKDIPGILGELRLFSEFYGTEMMLYGDDTNHNEMLISAFIEDHVMYVGEVYGEIVGLIGGLVNSHIYNPNIRVLNESFWWVNEDHRGGKLGLMLLNEFMEYGKGNADWIVCTLENDSPVNESVFLKRGFRMKEKSYLLEVN